MFNELKDWPRTLRINAAAVELAKAIHVAHCEAFGQPYKPWHDLHEALRRAFIEKATETLHAMQMFEVTVEPRAK